MIAEIIALAIGILGVAGVIFTALKFNRDDTTAIVGQQSTILHDMQAVNEELRKRADELAGERDELRRQVDRLTEQVRLQGEA